MLRVPDGEEGLAVEEPAVSVYCTSGSEEKGHLVCVQLLKGELLEGNTLD